MFKQHRLPSEWALAHVQQVVNWPKDWLERSEGFALALDFNELQDLVGKVMGGIECISMEK